MSVAFDRGFFESLRQNHQAHAGGTGTSPLPEQHYFMIPVESKIIINSECLFGADQGAEICSFMLLKGFGGKVG